jgi:hypothetical protein
MATQAGTVVAAEADTSDVTAIVPSRLSWAAIFGGAVAALAVWVLLYAFGLAVGLSTVNPDDPGSLRSSGIFTGIWGLIAPLVALFVGGMVAGRVSGVLEKGSDLIHGLLMWGMTTLIGTWMVFNVLGSLVSGVAAAGKAAAQAGGMAAGALVEGAQGAAGLPAALGVNVDDALTPLNQRLQAEGKPSITAAQLENTIRDSTQRAVREGRVDRDMLVQSIARNTALGQTDAEELAARLETQINQARTRIADRAESVGEAARGGALKAADATGKAFWGVFGALLLGLVAAIGGARVGMMRGRRLWAAWETSARGPVLRDQPGHA